MRKRPAWEFDHDLQQLPNLVRLRVGLLDGLKMVENDVPPMIYAPKRVLTLGALLK